MAKFYGTVKGRAATAATREGSSESGIRASAQSYDGSVVTKLSYNGETLMVELGLIDGSQSSFKYPSWIGTFEELSDVLRCDMQNRRML